MLRAFVSLTRTRDARSVATHVLRLETVAATLDARMAEAELERGECTITISIDELAEISADISAAAKMLRGYHHTLISES